MRKNQINLALRNGAATLLTTLTHTRVPTSSPSFSFNPANIHPRKNKEAPCRRSSSQIATPIFMQFG